MLRVEHAAEPDTRYLDELDLCGVVRVDVAVVNGTLSGYELKSDYDTLRRLPAQVRMYSEVLDRATLVVGERHRDHALAVLPDWWGVIVAQSVEAGVNLVQLRPARWNDAVAPMSIARLLWRDEVLEELEARGLVHGVRSKPRWVLWERLATSVPTTELRALVRHRLKTREGWRQCETPA